MCQMCEEYEAELRRMGIAEQTAVAGATSTQPAKRFDDTAVVTPRDDEKADKTLLIRGDRDSR